MSEAGMDEAGRDPLARWRPEAPLTEWELRALSSDELKEQLRGLRTEVRDGKHYLVVSGTDAEHLGHIFLETGSRLAEDWNWKMACGCLALALRSLLQALPGSGEEVADACDLLASGLYIVGDLPATRALQEYSLDLSRSVLGERHADTQRRIHNLALAPGDRSVGFGLLLRHEAEVRFRGASKTITYRVLSRGDVKSAKQTLVDSPRDRVLEEQVLELWRRVFGEEHLVTRTSRHNLSGTLTAQGDWPAATALALSALAWPPDPARAIDADFGYLAVHASVLNEHAAHLRDTAPGEQPAWLPEALAVLPRASDALANALDLCSRAERDRVLADFAGFHEAWAGLCLLAAPRRLPEALAPLQGLAAWSAALRRISDADPATLGPQAMEFRRLQEGLERQRLQLTDANLRSEMVLQWLVEWLAKTTKAAESGDEPSDLNRIPPDPRVIVSWVEEVALCQRRVDALPAKKAPGFHSIEEGRRRIAEYDLRFAVLQLETAKQRLAEWMAWTGAGDVPSALSLIASWLEQVGVCQRQVAALQAEEARLLPPYRAARQALAEADRRFAGLTPPGQGLSTDSLAAHLPDGEALALLFVLRFPGEPQEARDDAGQGSAAPKPAPGKPTRREVGYALVLRRGGHNGVVPLGDLAALTGPVGHYAQGLRAGSRGAGLRDSAMSDTVPAATGDTPPPSLDELTGVVRSGFWAPLREALDGARELHLVTGPGQHALPLELAAPEGVRIHRYFGLPGYLSLRDRALPVPDLGSAAHAVADPAWTTPSPIPFTEAEAAVTGKLLGTLRPLTGQALLTCDDLAPRLIFSLHGDHSGTAGHAHGYFLLDAAARPPVGLGPVEVGQLSQGLAEVFASVCLGAVVGTDEDGSAIGVASELQVRGIAALVGCLMPVADFYMPILAALFWFHRTRGAAPYEALARAKEQFRSGAWPDEIRAPLRAAYATTMEETLRRARCRPDDDAAARAAAFQAARSLSGWLLPEDVRLSWFDDAGAFDAESHAELSRKWLDDEQRRAHLAERCLDRLFGAADQPGHLNAHPAARAAIANICAFTQCFG